MKRIFLTLALALGVLGAALAQSPAKPVLKYKADGKFKIVQFTDLHYKYGKDGSKRALECINNVLESEQPDFVIITGDLIYGDKAEDAIKEITDPIVQRNIPFGITFGNHDHQFDRTLSERYDQVQAMPLSMLPERGDAASPDYTVELRTSDGAKIANIFYCIDSHAGARYKDVGRYDWIHTDQIMWYLENSRDYKAENGGESVPSLMFFHIPLMEFRYADANEKTPLFGNKREGIASPELNSGLFAAMRDEGDVVGVFCGHDHDNDFATIYYDILLAYGRYSGGNTVYNHLRPSGARVIELTEGSRDLRTWLRLADGTVEQETSFPADFKKK